jgi:hypothetical protein
MYESIYVWMDESLDQWLGRWMFASIAYERLDEFDSYSVCKSLFVLCWCMNIPAAQTGVSVNKSATFAKAVLTILIKFLQYETA